MGGGKAFLVEATEVAITTGGMWDGGVKVVLDLELVM